ncbi:5-hydroxytryptamine receptor 3A-like [Brienomyrus brachyistius]|uniref:5-hydroxytryptamine receptor 3A-like n=1 Tax=Brienomyrus brachyistius TaxID=42636 RepID=UPI0020B4292C|nr:5-hydroxytryptamine receptor 3A-like [Brienomyrus brachyistius]XP_048860397.1 5-hydroxytryptamine receptor 3A-like [Brienomyrus brachyistius]
MSQVQTAAGQQKGLNWLNSREKLVALLVASLLLQAPAVTCAVTVNCSYPDAKSLYKEIEKTFYLNPIRPVYSLQTPTNITIYFTLYGILGVDEKTQILTTYIWLTLSWEIEYLSWDPVQCGIAKITLPRQKLWMPDVVINECMDRDTSPQIPYVHLDSSGYVTDGRPVRSVSSCNLDIYTFPFDVQNCSLTFNSYIHTASDITINMGESGEESLMLSNMVMDRIEEWELVDITASKTRCAYYNDNFFDTVVYNVSIIAPEFSTDDPRFTMLQLTMHVQLAISHMILSANAGAIVMRRRPTTYVVNLLIPSCFLMIVDLISFLLPPEAVDRATFKMTIILGYTVFLLIMNNLLPITGNRLPLLNVVFSVSLALMVASLLETIIITKILCRSNHSAVPHWVKILVLKCLAWLVRFPQKLGDQDTDTYTPSTQAVKNPVSMSVSDPTSNKSRLQIDDPVVEVLKKLGQDLLAIRIEVEKHLTCRHAADEWHRVGDIIDRCFFILYVLFIFFSLIAFVIIWVQWLGK